MNSPVNCGCLMGRRHRDRRGRGEPGGGRCGGDLSPIETETVQEEPLIPDWEQRRAEQPKTVLAALVSERLVADCGTLWLRFTFTFIPRFSPRTSFSELKEMGVSRCAVVHACSAY